MPARASILWRHRRVISNTFCRQSSFDLISNSVLSESILLIPPELVFNQIPDIRIITYKPNVRCAVVLKFVNQINVKDVSRGPLSIGIELGDDIGFGVESGLLDGFELRNDARSKQV